MTRASLGRRLLLLFGAGLVALALGDLLVRWFGPRMSYSTKGFILTPSGERVPAAEIYHFMARRGDLSDEGEGPRGHLQPGLETRLGYEQPRWSYYDRDGCVTIRNNSLGFRDDEFPVQKPAGEWRALALGDSFTYGMGVRAEDNWPTVLERLLRAQRGAPVQVVNGGMACGNGARSAAEYAPWLEREGLSFGPDLVILGFCLNDFSDDIPMLGYQPPKYEPFLGGFSRTLDFLVQWRREAAVRLQPTTIDIDGIAARDAARWQAVREGMRRIQRALAAAKVPFVVAVFPMLSQLDGPYPYLRLHEQVAAFCKQEGILCTDLWPAFRGRSDQDLWVHPTDQHPNDVGHRIIAEQVFAFLREQELLPARAK
jgi:lysophospholipase L1-like esterase